MNALELRRRTLGKGVYKKTVEGNPAIAQGSLSRRYPGITMQGWTEQAQYEGNQLFNKDSCSVGVLESDGSVNEVSSANYRTTDYIPVNSGMSYTCTKTGSIRGKYFDTEKEPLQTINFQDFNFSAGGEITIPDDVYYIRFSMLEDNLETVMLNEGSTALPYEPYTGGAPSPSPDYKQDVKNAGKYNEETQKYQYEVKLTGKNLWDAEYFRTTNDWKLPEDMNGYPYIPIYIGKGNTITISTDGTLDEGLGFYCAIARTNKNTSGNIYTWLYHSTNTILIKTNVSFEVVDDDNIYFALNGGKSNIENFLNAFTNFQIEISAQRTEYQPYKEQTVTITSDRPLTKWDKLEKRNGQWGWVYKSNILTIDESINIQYGSGEQGETIPYRIASPKGVPNSNSNIVCISNILLGIQNEYWNTSSVIGTYLMNDGIISFRLKSDWASDINEAKQFLIDHDAYFVYETAEETFVPLSSSEQEQMNELYTFRPTTMLSNDCGCNMGLTYKTKKSLQPVSGGV